MSIKRGNWGGQRFSSKLIRQVNPDKLIRFGANLIRTGAKLKSETVATSIKGGQVDSTESDLPLAELETVTNQLGLTDLPSDSKKKKKITKTKVPKQNKSKQKQIKTKNVLKQKSKPPQLKSAKKPIFESEKTKKKSVKFQSKSKIPNIFD